MRPFALTLVLLVAALLPAPLPAGAQKKAALPTPVPTPLFRGLGLNAEQEARLNAADQAYRAELERVKASGRDQDLKARLQPAAEQYRQVLAATLTPAQQEFLLARYEEAGNYRALGDLAYYLAAVELSGEQKEKIGASAARYQPDLERLGAAAKLHRDEGAAREAASLREKLLAEVIAVLTPAQRLALPPAKKKGG